MRIFTFRTGIEHAKVGELHTLLGVKMEETENERRERIWNWWGQKLDQEQPSEEAIAEIRKAFQLDLFEGEKN